MASKGLIVSNYINFKDKVTKIDKESGQVLLCDFELVLEEELLA